MKSELYSVETFQMIMNLEEKKGRLKSYCYSQDTKNLSHRIKGLRSELRKSHGDQREELQQQLEDICKQYEESKNKEITEAHNKVVYGKFRVSLKEDEAKGKKVYSVNELSSLLLSKVIAQELKMQYQISLANRDEVVEELRVLMDNPMPKILVRADIHQFYESILQQRLMNKIESDNYLTSTSGKYLRKFFCEYNQLTNNQEHRGIPRGLSFSPVLAEIYLCEFDKKVKSIPGVFFYKRYVDDMVLLANQNKTTVKACWDAIREIAKEQSLTLHEDDDKIVRKRLQTNGKSPVSFNYLGYQFKFVDGHTDLLLTEDKVNKNCRIIDCVLKAYSKVANYRTKDNHGRKRIDGIIDMIRRIDALTGNGKLDGHKNFVKTGFYYSNRLLTDFSQIKYLDQYLNDAINDPMRFSPPRSLFNYGDGNNYDDNVSRIKEKIVSKYSFTTGFYERRMFGGKDYVDVLNQLHKLYNKSL